MMQRVEAGERVNRVSAVPTFVGDEHLPRQRTTDQAVAFLKVAEGCDYRCAFCIIPKLRGDQRSRPIESIVAEAHQLAEQGVQELILISQITTNYGLDLYGKPKLAELLRALGGGCERPAAGSDPRTAAGCGAAHHLDRWLPR